MEEQHAAIGKQMEDLADTAAELPKAEQVNALIKVRELNKMKEQLGRQMRRTAKELAALGFTLVPYPSGTKEFSEYLELKGLSLEELAQDRSGRYWEGAALRRH